MALNKEDKADVKNAMGKAMANKVAKVTRDSYVKEHGTKAKKMLKLSDSIVTKLSPKSKALGNKVKPKKSYTDLLEQHKAEARSFDEPGWKPKKKGQTFIQALEEHKERARKYNFD